MRAAWLVLAAAAACAGADARPELGREGPRLVVLVVVDQLPTWIFDKRLSSLPQDGGFRRVLRDGVYFSNALLPYAATSTSTGHAALTSGAPPVVSGIIGNKWFDREAGVEIEVVEDARQPLLEQAGGEGQLAGASPARLEVESVGDALERATGGRARAVSVSLKSRAAILMGGRRPTRAVWYEKSPPMFTTSRYYGERLPDWLTALARAHPIAPRLAHYRWTPRDPAALARATGLPDRSPAEPGKYGLGSSFPHVPSEAEHPESALVATPLADELVLEAALAAQAGEQLGRDAVPDLLCVSFSAHDHIGHGWGLESWESTDQFARLDGVLARFFAALDARVGRGRWALVLTSDHGGTAVPEHSGGAHVDPDRFAAPLEEAARAVAGEGDWIAFVHEQWIYLSPAARALPGATRDALLDALVAALRRQPGVAVALRTDSVRGGCERRSGIAALVCRAAHPRAGEIFWAPPPGSVAMKLPWDATNHISPNRFDRAVPLAVVAPGLRPRRVDGAVSTLQVAPTLARLLGIPPPRASTAPDLLGGAGPSSTAPARTGRHR